MKRKLLNAAALLLAASVAGAAGPQLPPKAPAAKTAAWDGFAQHSIKTGEIAVYTPVTGITTAQETYDIYAPFYGRVEELQTELFSFVTKKTVLARMVSTEMAALLDSSSSDSRKQTQRQWKDLYDYTELTPETQGVITNIHTKPKTWVNKGDRLFTVAKKVVIIGKNTKPLYSKLAMGATAEVEHIRNPDSKFEARLVNFLGVKDSPLTYRLWLEVQNLGDGIKIGEQFNGMLFVGKNKDAMLVPRKHIIESGGKRFLILEIRTGMETAEELEMLDSTSLYLDPARPRAAAAEVKDGKTKKAR